MSAAKLFENPLKRSLGRVIKVFLFCPQVPLSRVEELINQYIYTLFCFSYWLSAVIVSGLVFCYDIFK